MGKSDQKKTQNEITRTVDQNQQNTNAGISDAGARVNDLTTRSDAERAAINSGYSNLAATGGISQAQIDALMHPSSGSGSSSSSGGGGGGGGAPSYLDTFKELQGKDAGFDADRLSNINSDTDKLRNTSGNFGATDTSIGGLQNFAATGGVGADNISKIDNPTLEEFSQTGGYSDADKANIRARSNSGVSSFYTNLQDQLQRDRAASGNLSPGIAGTNLRLARQSAQDQGTNLRNTEADIADSVRQGRMDASSTLADKMLQLSGLQSQNTLTGYKSAGDLDLTKQGQISNDIAASGNLDLNTQKTMNDTRLAATSGLSQDAVARAGISAQQAMASAALNAENQRFLIGSQQQGMLAGNNGLLDTYKAAPAELTNEENLLRGYRQDQSSDNFNTINARIGASYIPGIGSTIKSGIGTVGSLIGGVAGGMTGLSQIGGMLGGGAGVGGIPGGTSGYF